jgi:hypothetical protein
MRFAIHTAAILIVLLIAGALLSWSSWSRFKIDCDLTDIARDIRRSALSLKDKEQLLDQIEAIEDRIDSGATVSLYQWLRSDRAVRDMLRAGITMENAGPGRAGSAWKYPRSSHQGYQRCSTAAGS